LYIESEIVEPESWKLLGVMGCGVFEERSGMSTVAVERAVQYSTEHILGDSSSISVASRRKRSISWPSCSSR
jgi:hypothetical protein